MSISTRRGDDGTTQLWHGPRVPKTHPRIEACGAIDELGAVLGLARSHLLDDPLGPRLEQLQRELFLLGAEIATPADNLSRLTARLTDDHLADLDRQVAEIEAMEGILSGWALPGASQAGALLDLARTTCRRAERRALAALGEPSGSCLAGQWLNRLSDLLWLYARWSETRRGLDGGLG